MISLRQLKVRLDIMMVGLPADDLLDKENGVEKKRKANREESLLEDINDPQKITVVDFVMALAQKNEQSMGAPAP